MSIITEKEILETEYAEIKARRLKVLKISIQRLIKEIKKYLREDDRDNLKEEFLDKIKPTSDDDTKDTKTNKKILKKTLKGIEALIEYLHSKKYLDKGLRKILSLSENCSESYQSWDEKIVVNNNDLKLYGLALSGGGIRSATFNLGILQAFSKNNFLQKFDYLSTVSGGGYIGASLSYNLQHDEGEKFPFERGTKVVRWIRRNASYLLPGDGLNNWALIAAVLRGIIINLVIIIPFLFFLMSIFTGDLLNILGYILYELNYSLDYAQFDLHIASLLNKWLNEGRLSGFIVLASFLFMYVLRHFWLKRYQKNTDKYKTIIWSSIIATLVALLGFSFSLFFIELFSFSKNSFHYSMLVSPVFLVALILLIYFFIIHKKDVNYEKAHNFLGSKLIASLLKIITWLPAITIVSIIQEPLLDITAFPFGFQILLLMGIAILSRLMIANIFYAFLSFVPTDRIKIRTFSVQYGDYLLWGLLFIVMGGIPLIYHLMVLLCDGFQINVKNILSSTSLLALLTVGIGWVINSKKTISVPFGDAFLGIGVSLLFYSMLLWIYYFLQMNISVDLGSFSYLYLLCVVIIIWVSLVISTNINQVSVHRYYRNRLVEAFFQRVSGVKNSSSEELNLVGISVGESGAPYPIINTNVVTIGSKDTKYANRLGDSFIFSPKFIGSEATEWANTNCEAYQNKSLETAMAISGAAVDPNIGETKSWPLRIMMGLLNVRLGYWLVNPSAVNKKSTIATLWQESWLNLIAREIFGFPREDWSYVRLSDGGHFENLGLYELVRRQCKVIIVSDAGADPEWLFSDLSRAIQRIRVDFEADIDINLRNVKPDKDRYSKEPFVTGTIKYQDGTKGRLIYIKTTLFSGLPEDVLGYARKNDKFPDESSTDQFFTEDQFEAYRILGYHAGIQVADIMKLS